MPSASGAITSPSSSRITDVDRSVRARRSPSVGEGRVCHLEQWGGRGVRRGIAAEEAHQGPHEGDREDDRDDDEGNEHPLPLLRGALRRGMGARLLVMLRWLLRIRLRGLMVARIDRSRRLAAGLTPPVIGSGLLGVGLRALLPSPGGARSDRDDDEGNEHPLPLLRGALRRGMGARLLVMLRWLLRIRLRGLMVARIDRSRRLAAGLTPPVIGSGLLGVGLRALLPSPGGA